MTSLLQFLCLLALLSIASGSSRERISADHGVVATDHGLCSGIGRDVLKEGGHAVDAAVASALCLGVVSPASSGIGGGAFLLVHSAGGETEAYDLRETAPKGASKDIYAGNAALKASGPLSVAVPGELAGLTLAWSKYGTLPWKRLVAPAAQLAMKGFKISPYLHMQMVSAKSGIMADEGLRAVFTSNGSMLRPGDVCYNKELAKTLDVISRVGMKAFYNGSIGENLVKDVKEKGGILTMEDLQNYSVKMRKPLRRAVMGVDILGMPPPSSGGASMALMLSILAWYEDLKEIPSSLLTHREIEALKHAFAVRSWLGDPDFADIRAALGDMISVNFSFDIRKTVLDNTTFNSSHYGGSYGAHEFKQTSDHGGSHISIVDSQRNAVSMTTTINAYFGAKLMSKSTGIILNNEMDDFSIPSTANADPANFIEPGKRPLSSMTPTIILHGGRIKAVIGASGGANMIAATTEVVKNHFTRGMDPLAAVVAPRSYHQLIPNVLQYENWTVPTGGHFEVPKETRDALAKRGHVLQSLSSGTICQFVVHDLSKDSNVGPLVGVSDPRKGGFPAGF